MMKSKLFTSSILLIFSLPLLACGPLSIIPPEQHWLFYTGYRMYDAKSTYWRSDLDEKFRNENINFWHDYVENSVPRDAVEAALYDEILLDAHSTNAFFRYLLDHHDTTALHYWMSLKSNDSVYVKQLRWKQSAWWYPETDGDNKWNMFNDMSVTESDDCPVDLSILKVRELDEACIKQCRHAEIRNRYLLQVMRKYFYTENFAKCISVWKKYGANVPESALRTQCLNYYGGALLRMGREAEAATVYAGIGYYNVYLHYNPDVLRKVYQKQPNCKEFEFMVQQFVNQYFDHPKKSKAEAFNSLADEIVRAGRNRNPALWRSAQATIAYINRDTPKAVQLLAEAEKMRGTPVVKENIRMLRLIVNSTRTDIDSIYEAKLYPDLKWLAQNIQRDLCVRDSCLSNHLHEAYCSCSQLNDYSVLCGEGPYSSNLASHRVKVLRRVIFLGAMPHFKKIGQTYKSIAYLNLYDVVFRESELLYYLDTTRVGNIIRYARFLQSGGRTPMEKFLIQNNHKNINYFYDFIGTQYMRTEQYAAALPYLEKVSEDFREEQRIAEYLTAKQNPFAEEWITKKENQGVYGLSFNPMKEYAKNPGKLTFCQLMIRLQKEIQTANTAEKRAKAAYAYAIGLYQSSIGYAWALNRYYTSFWDNPSVPGDIPKYADKSLKERQNKVEQWLDRAMKYKKDKVFSMKCKIPHRRYRSQLKETVTVKYSWGEVNVQQFNKEVRSTFCDRFDDHNGYSNPNWLSSVWYY